jgi:uncharacterized membrane protein YdjX (TVP38/TMEM64 family)
MTTDRTRPRRLLQRFGPLAILAAVAVGAYAAGLPHMLTPEALGREQAQLQAAAAAAPVLSLGIFVVGYAALTGACLPVALMLSLLGGLIFGPWLGAIAVLLGATGGAIFTYAAARSAFAHALVARAERDPRVGKVVAGFGRNAFRYILTLRLVPFVPFALVNVAAGLAAAPMRAFAAATLAGGAPAALIYANLGAGLGASLSSPDALHEALHSPRVLVPVTVMMVLAAAPTLWTRLRRGRAPV